MKIDSFAHVLPTRYRGRVFEVLEARGDQSATDYAWMLGNDPTLQSLEARFQLMDEVGSDYRQVLVMAHTSVEGEDAEVAAELAAIGNEDLSQLVTDHPDRFVGWVAQVALQDGDRALASVEKAITEQGALGVQVFTRTQERPLDHPDFEPFFALMADLDRPIWIHPNRTIASEDFMGESESRFGLYSRTGWPTDTTNTLARLVYAGYLERWPDLKVIGHHSAGTLPMVAGRLKNLPYGHEATKVAARLKHSPMEYFKRYYADTANFGNPAALRAAMEFFGPDHVLFGTDFGFSTAFAPNTVDDVEIVVTDQSVKRAVYEGNARRVLRLDERKPELIDRAPDSASATR